MESKTINNKLNFKIFSLIMDIIIVTYNNTNKNKNKNKS